jgi:peptidoglycan/xylan/chitin deacetylase (PgdA/CDA1 family)
MFSLLIVLPALAFAAYQPFDAPKKPINYPPATSAKISEALLADPMIEEAYQFVLANVPASLLDIPVLIANPDAPESPVIPPGYTAATACLWQFGQCVRTQQTENFYSDVISCPNNNEWGMTYNGGPTDSATETRLLVAALDARSIKATFFMAGYHVAYSETSRSLAASMAATGHEVQLHTWTETPLATQTNREIIAELLYTESMIYDAAKIAPTLFRPPYGLLDDRVRAISSALGFQAVLWNKDSGDTFKSVDEARTEIATWWPTAGPGIIGVQHDSAEATVATSVEALAEYPDSAPMKAMPVGTCLAKEFYKVPGTKAIFTSAAPVTSSGGNVPGASNPSGSKESSANSSVLLKGLVLIISLLAFL